MRLKIALIAECVLTFIIYASAANYQSPAAQIPSPTPVHSSAVISSVWWSSNSRRVVFSNESPALGEASANSTWFQYDIKSAALSESRTWPLFPPLGLNFWENFNILMRGTQRSFIYTSPDDNYAAYPGFLGANQASGNAGILLGSFAQKRSVSAGVNASSPISDVPAFNIIWNTSSSAFIINQSPDEGVPDLMFAGVVTNFQTNLFATQLHTAELQIGRTRYLPIRGYSISTDGEWILMKVYRDVPGVANFDELDVDAIAWSWRNPAKSRVLVNIDGRRVTDMVFANPSSDSAYLLTERGLIKFDLSAQTYNMLRNDVNSAQVVDAKFSFDGAYVAFVRYADSRASLYVLKVITAP